MELAGCAGNRGAPRYRPQQALATTAVGATAATPAGRDRGPAVDPFRRRRCRAPVPRNPVCLGGRLTGRVRLLRPRDVRLLAGRRLAAALLLRDVRASGRRCRRISSSPETSSSSTATGTSGSTSAAVSSSTPRTRARSSRSRASTAVRTLTGYDGARRVIVATDEAPSHHRQEPGVEGKGEGGTAPSSFHLLMRTTWNGSISLGSSAFLSGSSPATASSARQSDVQFKLLHPHVPHADQAEALVPVPRRRARA